jgi:hypothetical protein
MRTRSISTYVPSVTTNDNTDITNGLAETIHGFSLLSAQRFQSPSVPQDPKPFETLCLIALMAPIQMSVELLIFKYVQVPGSTIGGPA